MGIWAGIKRALNSTLGTSEFKPLDQIIEGQRTLAASDSIISVVRSVKKGVGYRDYSQVGSFIPQKNGSVRIILDCDGYYSSSGVNWTIQIQNQQGAQVSTVTQNIVGDNKSETADGTISFDIPVEKGTQYNILAIQDVSIETFYVRFVKIGANVVDASLISVVEGE